MKSFALLLAPLAAVFAAPALAAERNYSVTDFDRVQIEGPYEVTLTTGGPSHARAVGSQAAIDRVSIELFGRVLKVRTNRSAWGGYPGAAVGSARIELGTRILTGATVIGSGRLAIDRVRGLKVDLAVSGSGHLAVAAVDADTLVVGLLGSGAIELGGKAKMLRATVQGSGDLDGTAFIAEDAVLTADTAGRIAIGAGRTVKVTAIGPGEVHIAGKAACTSAGPAAGAVVCGR